MDLMKAIKERRSIRFFEKRDIEKEKIDIILEAAICAPSAGNIQPWYFISIRNKEKLENIKAFSPGIVGNPSAIIVACINKEKYKKNNSEEGETLATIDVAMACQNMLLAAYNLGLGACVIGSLNKIAISKLTKLPPAIIPQLLVILGYPAKIPSKPSKLPFEAVVGYEKYEGGDVNV